MAEKIRSNIDPAQPETRQRCRAPRRMTRWGGALIEVALAFPIITSLTFGMVEFGHYFYIQNIFEGAARAGARAGAPWNTTLANIQTAVSNAIAPSGISTSNPPYTVAVKDTSGNTITDLTTVSSGSQFSVTISAPWGTIGSGFRPMALIGATKTLSSTCVMQKEY